MSFGRRCGMTLLEVLTASALFALLLGGMASSVFLARMCVYEAGDHSAITGAASGSLFWMSQDIGEAISIEAAIEDRLAITVPDRDGDGTAETIEFLWVAASSSLERKLNTDAPETLVKGLSDFRFSYQTRSETVPTSATFAPEQLLMAHDSTSNLSSATVNGSFHRGQYFAPALPGGAVSWVATRARLRMRDNGTTDGEATIQLRSAIGRLPGGEILAEVVLREKRLASSFAWFEVRFKPAPEPIAAGLGVCLVVQGTGAGDACALQYQSSNSTAAGTDFVRSDNGGVQWIAPAEQDLLFELYGMVGTPANNVTETYLQRVGFEAVTADPASVVHGSAPALNQPKVN